MDVVAEMLKRLKDKLAQQYTKPASKRVPYETSLAEVVREAGYRGSTEYSNMMRRLAKAHADDKRERRIRFMEDPRQNRL